MVGALALVTLRQIKAHKLRLGLTMLGIVLGASVYFAMRTANASLLNSLKLTVEKLAGKANLQVTAGESGFPEEVLDVVRLTPGVELAEPIIEVVAHTAFEGEGNLVVMGVDVTGDQRLREYQFDSSDVLIENPLEYVSRPRSIMVARQFADRHGLRIGDKLPLYTSQGRLDLTVLGVFKPVGIGEVFDGMVAVMDIYGAQHVFGRGNNYDRIDIVTSPGVEVDGVRASLRERLPPGIEVTSPILRGKNIENVVATMSQGFLLTSLVALLVGAFIIFNSFNIAVNQRWKEVGILRAVGVERSNVSRMFLGEALLMGVIGSGAGVGIGYLLALGANRVVSSIAASTYGLLSTSELPTLDMQFVFEAFILGIAASMASAWLPAQAASRLNPVLALHNIEIRQKDEILRFAKARVGILLIIGGVLLIRFTTPKVGLVLQFSYAALILLGFVLLLPALARWTGRLMRPAADRLFGSEGVLAVDSMVQAPLRTSATVAALMIGLAFVYSTGAFIQSQKRVVVRSMEKELTSDLYVAASDLARSRSHHFTEELGRKIAALPGVRSVENLRWTFVPYDADNVALLALEMEGWFARVTDVIQEGSEKEARLLVPRGEAVLISHNFATRWNVGVGDELRLETPVGPLVRPVVGVVEDYSSEKGSILMDRDLYKSYWKDSAVDFFDINLKPGVERGAFKKELQQVLAGDHRAFIYTNREYKEWILGVVDQFFTLNYAQMFVAVLVAAIGIINTLFISVAERKREIGVLRAIGGYRSQIRKMVLVEAVVIGLTGLVAAVLKSGVDTFFLVRTAAVVIGGYTVPYHFPADLILLSIPVVIAGSLAAAWFPARQAVSRQVVDAIGYE